MELIGQKELLRILPISRSTLWRLRRGGRFPAAVQLTARRIAYRRDEVEAWMNSRTREGAL